MWRPCPAEASTARARAHTPDPATPPTIPCGAGWPGQKGPRSSNPKGGPEHGHLRDPEARRLGLGDELGAAAARSTAVVVGRCQTTSAGSAATCSTRVTAASARSTSSPPGKDGIPSAQAHAGASVRPTGSLTRTVEAEGAGRTGRSRGVAGPPPARRLVLELALRGLARVARRLGLQARAGRGRHREVERRARRPTVFGVAGDLHAQGVGARREEHVADRVAAVGVRPCRPRRRARRSPAGSGAAGRFHGPRGRG